MNANTGKYVDRLPGVRTAGLTTGELAALVPFLEKQTTVKDCLNYPITIDDAISAFTDYCNKDCVRTDPVIYPMKTEVWQLLHSAEKTTFQTLLDELENTSYASYWKVPVGRSRDPLPGLPAGTDIYGTTFGKKSISCGKASDIVNPQKLPEQVNFESNIGRELYRKTHNEYLPGEQIDREYSCPGFCPEKKYGIPTPQDPSGGLVRRLMKWKTMPSVESTIASQFNDQWKHKLGRVQEPNKILNFLPKDHAFGVKLDRELYGVEDLLRECPPSLEKRDLLGKAALMNRIRLLLKTKSSTFLRDLHCSFREQDKDLTGFISLETFYKVCEGYQLNFSKSLIEEFMKDSDILVCDQKVDYNKFIDSINNQCDFLPLKKVKDVPDDNLHFETTYNATVRHAEENKHVLNMKPFGKKSEIFGQLPAELRLLGFSTDNCKALVSPSIFTYYGLTYKDFFRPRSKDQMRNIFKNIGLKISDEVFEELWEEGKKLDNTGGVCVETFRNLLDQKAFKILEEQICE